MLIGFIAFDLITSAWRLRYLSRIPRSCLSADRSFCRSIEREIRREVRTWERESFVTSVETNGIVRFSLVTDFASYIFARSGRGNYNEILFNRIVPAQTNSDNERGREKYIKIMQVRRRVRA